MNTLKKVLIYMRETPPSFEGAILTDEEIAQGNNYYGAWAIWGTIAVILVALMFV
jgi:hypothetical protein